MVLKWIASDMVASLIQQWETSCRCHPIALQFFTFREIFEFAGDPAGR